MPGSLERIPVRHLGNVTKPIDPNDSTRRRWMEEESGWDIPPVASLHKSPAAALPVVPQTSSAKVSPTTPKVLSESAAPSAKESVTGPQVKVE